MPNELEQVCLDLSDKFLAKLSYRDQFLDAEALSAVNRFELACEGLRRKLELLEDLGPGTWDLGPGTWDLGPGTWDLGPRAMPRIPE